MTSDANGNYTNAYTYGLDRISVDKLSPNSDAKTDPLFYLYDGRGSVANTTNSLGQVRDKYRYDPYGEVKHGGFWGSNGTHYENFYGYNGEDYNRLSGLEYLRARYYEPESGRFLTRDSYLGPLDTPENYEIINYINDVSLENPEVLMTSDANGNYTNAYTYGLDRISVDKLSPNSDAKTDPLFYLYDGRGSVANTTNSLGQVRDKYRYDPYGEVKHGGFWGSNGTHYENFYGYNGEDYNRLSGLEYLRARYYEPESGRFLTRDSYLGDVMQPLTLNRYAYALNNPMMYTDPSGHWPGWLDKAASSAKNFVSNAVDTVSNYVSKAVSYVEDVVSTGWGYVKKAYNYVADNVKSWVNSTKEKAKSFVTEAEQKISSAKENIKNTANKIVQLAKPVISTMSHPNEVVRLAMDTIKKGCEGDQYVASQAYKYSDNIIKVATGVAAVVAGVAAITIAAPVILPALAAGFLEMGIVAIGAATLGTTATAMGASEISDGLFGVNPTRELASNVGISNEDYDLMFAMVTGGASIGANYLATISQTSKPLPQNTTNNTEVEGNPKIQIKNPKDAGLKPVTKGGVNTTKINTPSANTKVINAPEVKAPNVIKSSEVTGNWENYLGGNTTNINPRTGQVDPNRIFSADGTKSIRFDSHEMNSMGTTKFHYHMETWTYDAVNDTMTVTNTLQRIK
ncbi:RHS repeat-associated core domain-containing protein [Clostridium tunisiense]|uniref:RHS repeat-associated core domain-containing protein n=1 Tax=Clostridium tunisiense TaxID=219748 RepID=UPI00030F551C|nr:RHS repeat-associated core domain-containing protein [Clostridium tunisiense]